MNEPANEVNNTRNKPGPPPGEGGAPTKPESKRKKVNTGFRTTEGERDRIDAAAESAGISRGELIRRAIRDYLDEREG